MEKLILVAAGGALGSALRFASVGWFTRHLPNFPWGTVFVNVLGSAVMGLVAVLLMERLPGSWARYAPFLMTGVLGGFTTFSAFSLDALFLMERGRLAAATVYIAGSVGLSIAALALGLAAGRGLWLR